MKDKNNDNDFDDDLIEKKNNLNENSDEKEKG